LSDFFTLSQNGACGAVLFLETNTVNNHYVDEQSNSTTLAFGEEYIQHQLPISQSQMPQFQKRIGEGVMHSCWNW